ncbi:hypothetical protein KAW65_00640 [candidate division WOR-3 bacterium]|nr:hypothetical protein [candidate division WOR-3 bacterium]
MEDKDSKIINQRRNVPMREERCYEPVARCLIRALIVPKIYFERVWPKSDHSRIDIVVVDRAGTGDIHVVEVCRTLNEALTKGVRAICNVPTHYRWVAFQGEGILPHNEEAELKLLSEEPLLPESGMGRIGVIEVIRTGLAGNDLGANIKVGAERFRVGDISTLVEEFVNHEKADIEFKE